MALRFLMQPIAALLVPLVAFALAKSEAAWLRPMLNTLAAGLRKVWFVGSTLSAGVLHVEAAVRHYLGALVLSAEQPAVKWILALRTFVLQFVYVVSNSTIATARAVETLAGDVLAKLEVPVKVTLRETRTKVRVLDRKTIAAIAAAVASIQALKHTATVTVPGEIAGEISDLRDYVNRRANKLAEKLRRLEKPAVGVLTAALVLTMLKRLGLGWTRCSKVGRVGKNVCGMNTDLLDSLLADALLVVGAISIVEFAKELQTIETATVSAMRGFVREI